jgi:effector-binding domain-containing protein
MSYESPNFKVIQKEGAFELRSYEVFYTSSVEQYANGSDSGFSVLFSYISGENKQRQPMAMTVPVINEFNAQSTTMEFVIPRQFYGSSIPQPTRDGVVIRHYPAQLMATFRFSGSMTEAKLTTVTNQLKAWIQKLQLSIVSPLRMARYNSPFSLPMFRHNEILFSVEQNKK